MAIKNIKNGLKDKENLNHLRNNFFELEKNWVE